VNAGFEAEAKAQKPQEEAKPSALGLDSMIPQIRGEPSALTILNNLVDYQSLLKNNKVCIIDPFATWCPPCVEIAPAY